METQPDDSGPGTGPVPDKPMTAVEAAKVAGVHERTIRRAITNGYLKATKRQHSFRIMPADLRAWQQEQDADTVPDPQPGTPPADPVLIDELRRQLDQERAERQEAQRKVAELTGQIGYYQGQADAFKSQLAALTAGPSEENQPIAADFIHRTRTTSTADSGATEGIESTPDTLHDPSWLSAAWSRLTGRS